MAQVQSGGLRALAINSARRLPAFPEVPTFAEAGLPEYTMQLWFALVGPKGIPGPVIERMNGAMRKVLGDPEMVASFEKQGVELQWTTPAQLVAHTAEQSARMKQLITSRKIKAD
jgi:tripartite-type tricarboxylate transporter receptor subunit TctC